MILQNIKVGSSAASCSAFSLLSEKESAFWFDLELFAFAFAFWRWVSGGLLFIAFSGLRESTEPRWGVLWRVFFGIGG